MGALRSPCNRRMPRCHGSGRSTTNTASSFPNSSSYSMSISSAAHKLSADQHLPRPAAANRAAQLQPVDAGRNARVGVESRHWPDRLLHSVPHATGELGLGISAAVCHSRSDGDVVDPDAAALSQKAARCGCWRPPSSQPRSQPGRSPTECSSGQFLLLAALLLGMRRSVLLVIALFAAGNIGLYLYRYHRPGHR